MRDGVIQSDERTKQKRVQLRGIDAPAAPVPVEAR